MTLLRFTIVGSLALGVENLIVYLFHTAAFSYIISRLVGTIFALIISYIMNSLYTYGQSLSYSRFLKYTTGVMISIVVSYIASLSAYYYLFDASHPLISVNLGAAVAMLVNFLYQTYFTFASR